MIVSYEDLQDFAGISTDAQSLVELQIQGAQEIVEDFLGYGIEETEKTLTLSGDLDRQLNLGAPIGELSGLSFDGEEQDLSEFYSSGEYLCRLKAPFPRGERNISVTFTAGYATEDIPAVMKLTVLEIAAVLFSQGDGNIGVQSISDPNTGSRTFMERSFKRYLNKLISYKVAPW